MGTTFVNPFFILPSGPADSYLSYVSAHYPLRVDGSNARGVVSPVTTTTPLVFYSSAAVNSTHTLNGNNTLRLNSNYADLTWTVGSTPESEARRNLFNVGIETTFTVECYAYFNTLPTEVAVLETRGYVGTSPFNGYGFDMTLRSGKLLFGLVSGPSGAPVNSFTSTPATAISTGAWYHLCAERSGSTLRAYVNGAKVGENLATVNGASPPATPDDAYGPVGFTVGAAPGSGTAAGTLYPVVLDGAIADIRITKGICRYGCPTTSFTPDVAPFPTI